MAKKAADKKTEQVAPPQFLMGYMNDSGQMVVPAMYESVNAFSDGLAAVKVGGLWGFINTKNEMVVQPQYDLVGLHKGGRFPFREKTIWGVASVDGKRLIEPTFKNVLAILEHVIVVKDGAKISIVSHDNKSLISNLDGLTQWSDGVAIGTTEGLSGLINEKGEWVLKPQYQAIYNFKDKFGAFVHEGKAGYLNPKGEVAIPAKYTEAYDFNEGLARVRTEDGFGYINQKGELVIPCKWGEIREADSYCSDGRVLVVDENEKYGFLDSAGKVVHACDLDNAHAFSDGLAYVYKDKIASFIDTSGKVAFTPQMATDLYFKEGLISFVDPKETYPQKRGFMDKSQKVVIKNVLPGDGSFTKNGVAILKSVTGSSFMMINKKGETLIDGLSIEPKFSEGLAAVRNTNAAWEEFQENLELDQKFLDRIEKFEKANKDGFAKDAPNLVKGIEKFLAIKLPDDVEYVEFEIYHSDDFGVVIRPHTKDGDESVIEDVIKPLKGVLQAQEKSMPPESKSRKGHKLVNEAFGRNGDAVLQGFVECWSDAGAALKFKLPAYVRLNDHDEYIDLKTKKKVKEDDL